MRVGDTVYVVVRCTINAGPETEVYIDERRLVSHDQGEAVCLWNFPHLEFWGRDEVFELLAGAETYRNLEAARLRKEGKRVMVFGGVNRNGCKVLSEDAQHV